MKKQIPILKTLIHAAVVLVATALVSSASAQTVAFGDINNDGHMDMAVLTSPTTITVSLANPDGGYTVSAIFSVPKTHKITSIGLYDFSSDGFLDVWANIPAAKGYMYTYNWWGNGDGTFDSPIIYRWRLNGPWLPGF